MLPNVDATRERGARYTSDLVFKSRIPPLVTPLCLTLTTAVACGPKSPEELAEDFCLKLIECTPPAYEQYLDQYAAYCQETLAKDFQELRENYGDACWGAYVELYECYFDGLTCEEIFNNDGNRCMDEYEEAERCNEERAATIPESTTLPGVRGLLRAAGKK